MSLGYQPLSAIDRKIISAPQFDKYFDAPKPGGLVKKLVDANGGVEQTVKQMVDIVNNNYKEVNRAKHLIQGKTILETAKNIFDFLYKHVKYNLERGEILNSPAASYYYGQVKARQNPNNTEDWPVDCDDFSIFAASFLKSLGMPWAFRIASYNGTNYSHVYCVIPGKQEIIIDPVYYAFNKEKPYKKQKTFGSKNNQLSGMQIYTQGISGLSGLGNYDIDDQVIELAGGKHFSGLGLGDVGESEALAHAALTGYLGDTLSVAKQNPGSISSSYQNPQEFIGMLEKAISGMNTADEEDILNILAKQESEMLSGTGRHSLNGVFSGNDDFYLDEDYTGSEPEEDGLYYHYQDGERYFNSLDGFFGRIRLFRKLAKRHRTNKYNRLLRKKPTKAAAYKAKTTKRVARRSVRRVKRRTLLKNAAKFFNKVNPVTLVARNSLRVLLALNFANVSGGLMRNKKAYSKVLDLYRKLGGKSTIVAKSIAKGAKRKPMFHRKGKVKVSGLEGLGIIEDMTSILKSAGGILKKIIVWLKERKQLKVVAKEKGIDIKDARAQYKAGKIKLPVKVQKEHKLVDKIKKLIKPDMPEQAAPQPEPQYVNRDDGYKVDSRSMNISPPPPQKADYKKYGIIAGVVAAGAGVLYAFNHYNGVNNKTKSKLKPLQGIKLK